MYASQDTKEIEKGGGDKEYEKNETKEKKRGKGGRSE
jgi:hypothetical protein